MIDLDRLREIRVEKYDGVWDCLLDQIEGMSGSPNPDGMALLRGKCLTLSRILRTNRRDCPGILLELGSQFEGSSSMPR